MLKHAFTLSACVAAATILSRADETPPEVVVCPVYLPDGTVGPVTYGPRKDWYSVDFNAANRSFETFDLAEPNFGLNDPIIITDPVIDPPVTGGIDPVFYVDPAYGRLADLGLGISWIVGSSLDGNTVVAYDLDANPLVADLATGAVFQLGMVARSLFADPGEIVTADMVALSPTAISADGTTVVGDAYDAGGVWRWRRTDDMLTLLPLELPHAAWSQGSAMALSSSGDVVVGYGVRRETETFHALMWNAAGQLTELNPLQSADTGSMARFVTPDGSVIAGDYFSRAGVGVVPFVWNQADGFTALGDPLASDDQVLVNSLSSDGLVLSGNRYDAAGVTSWYWTKDTGFVDIEKLSGHEDQICYVTGIDPSSGVAYGCYADGGYFLRSATGDIVDPEAWLTTLSGPIASTAPAFALASQPMEGAHHRPLSSCLIPGKNEFAWVTGDYGTASKGRDLRQGAGELGYGFRVGQGGVIGFSAGFYDQHQGFDHGGSGESTGRFVVGEAGFGLGRGQLSLTALYGTTSVDTVRGYVVGLGTQQSRGHTDGKSFAFRARLDGSEFGTYAGQALSPFASLTYDHTQLDGYAETGGAFPAVFNDRSDSRTVGRLGLVARAELGKSDTLRTTLEFAHSFSGSSSPISGTDTATGLVDFSVPGTAVRTEWGRVGLDLDHRIDASTVLNLTVHASTRGDAFDVAGAVSLRKGF